jgi:peroxiredoxin
VIQPSSQDSKIRFITAPGTGLSAADEWRIAAEVRQVLRQGLTMTPVDLPTVDLPTNFPFTVFKGLGSGSSQVIALPLHLSGASLPASGLQSLTQSFIGSSGFAFAVSKEYLITDDIHDHRHPINLGAIREAIRSRPVPLPGATYHLHFSSGPTLTFKNGGIEISGQVEAETSTFWAPNGYIKFKQLVTLVLDTSTQTAKLEQVGEPEVSVSWDLRLFGLSPSKAATIIKSEIEKALSASADPIKRVFINVRSALVEGLRTLDSFAAASYTAVEITPDDCVIVRGEIGSITIGWGDDIPHIRVRRRPPVVDIAETHQGAAFTAFRSWIPGGRIDRFIWSWVEHAGPYYDIWSGTAKSFTDEHRFILPKPAGITEMSQICLRVEGTRIIAGGQEEAIAGGSTCQIPQPEFAIDVPSWWEPVTLPVWRPDLADTMILRGAIAGHISVTPHAPGQETFSRNTLVYFADWRSEKPLDNLSIALTRVRKSSALMVIVILPAGTFDSSRREFESRLPSAREFGATFQFSEDDEEGWTRTFAVARTPSVYLVNARGEFVWKHEGEPDPKVLATALDQHLVPTQASRFRPLRLTVSPGDFAPDILFKDDDRREFALHRFRGRQNVLLNFCQSWSAPCVTELSRLQRLHQAGRGAPFIVSFHGGKNSKGLNEIRKRLGLSFSLVQDSRQRIARRYGVGCWPTTIMVDADGRVEHVQFGIGHENELLPVREQSNPDGLRA